MLRPAQSFDANKHAFSRLLASTLPKRVIVTSTALSWIPLCVSRNVATFIDGEAANITACLEIPEIVTQLQRFSGILFAWEQDYKQAVEIFGPQKCVLAPTPIALSQQARMPRNMSAERQRVGVYCGAGRLSYDAVMHFHDAIWSSPKMQQYHDKIKVVFSADDLDPAAKTIVKDLCPDFDFVSAHKDAAAFFNSLCCVYIPKSGDLPQAPIMDALSYLCPVITVPKASVALPVEVQQVCSVKEMPEDIIQEILQFVRSSEASEHASQRIKACATDTLSAQTCFASLAIGAPSRAVNGAAVAPSVPVGGCSGVAAEIPAVCVLLRKFENHQEDWLPLTRMKGVRVLLRNREEDLAENAEDCCGDSRGEWCQLLITDDKNVAMDMALNTSKDVWLCDLQNTDVAGTRVRLFPCVHGVRWCVGELAAHLAVWLRNYAANDYVI